MTVTVSRLSTRVSLRGPVGFLIARLFALLVRVLLFLVFLSHWASSCDMRLEGGDQLPSPKLNVTTPACLQPLVCSATLTTRLTLVALSIANLSFMFTLYRTAALLGKLLGASCFLHPEVTPFGIWAGRTRSAEHTPEPQSL